MRIPLCIMMVIGTWLAASTAQAQTYDPRYPVCMHVFTGGPGGGGDFFDCSFMTLDQCRASASGRPASCDVNPYYVPSGAPVDRRVHRRHHHRSGH